MKRQCLPGRPLVALLGGLLALGGCSRPGPTPGDDEGTGRPVEISVAARSTDGYDKETYFDDGTSIGIVTADGGNREYTYNWGEPLTAVDGKVFFEAGAGEIAVEAFYPYNASGYERLTIKANQNDYPDDESNYYLSDVLHAAGSTTKAENDLQLQFHHVMSKLVFKVNTEEGRDNITSLTVEGQPLSAAFTFAGDGSVEGVSGIGAENASINVCDYYGDWYAIIIPRDNVPLTVTAILSGKTYTATLPPNNFEPGKQYTYNITVKNGKLQVTITGNGVTWQEAPATVTPPVPATFKVTLAGDYPSSLTLTNLTATTEPNVYKTVSGNSFSISYTIPEGEDNKKFDLTQGAGKQELTENDQMTCRTFTCSNVRSDLWLEYKPYAMRGVGDYYYYNGKKLPFYVSNTSNPCVGVVFKVGPGNGDDASGYGGKLADNTIHGYVVALTDAHAEAGGWGIRETTESIPQEDKFANTYNGYTNTLVIRGLEKYATTNVANPRADNQYWAFRVASDYNVSLPASTSGWYLPSIGQLQDIYNANLNDRFTAAGGTAFSSEDDGRYWSATQYNNKDSWYLKFNDGVRNAFAKSPFKEWFDPSRVRAVFTF